MLSSDITTLKQAGVRVDSDAAAALSESETSRLSTEQSGDFGLAALVARPRAIAELQTLSDEVLRRSIVLLAFAALAGITLGTVTLELLRDTQTSWAAHLYGADDPRTLNVDQEIVAVAWMIRVWTVVVLVLLVCGLLLWLFRKSWWLSLSLGGRRFIKNRMTIASTSDLQKAAPLRWQNQRLFSTLRISMWLAYLHIPGGITVMVYGVFLFSALVDVLGFIIQTSGAAGQI